MKNDLQRLFDKHKCDKGSLRHRYDRVYEPVFSKIRNEEVNIFEIGIFKGESLKVFLEYFSLATIFGIDIFTRVLVRDIPVLDDDRIVWAKCDSVEGPNQVFNMVIRDDRMDVIIDDGLHTHDAQRLTFLNFMPYLKPDGVYFIEDVWPFDRMTKSQKNHHWIKSHASDFSDKQYQELMDALSPYDVKFHDLRQGYHEDTFIIEVRNK